MEQSERHEVKGGRRTSDATSPTQGLMLLATWTGFPLALGAVVAAVGAFLPYEQLRTGLGSYSFTGVGSENSTGGISASLFMPGNVGISVLVLALVTLLCSLLIVLRQGRWWIGLGALILSGIGLGTSIFALTVAHRDAARFSAAQGIDFVGSAGVGAVLGAVGMGVALVSSLLALVVRSRASRGSREAPGGHAEPERASN